MKRALRNAMALTAMLLLVTFMACSDSSGSSKNSTASDTGTTLLSEIDDTDNNSLDIVDSNVHEVTNIDVSEGTNNQESDSTYSSGSDDPDVSNSDSSTSESDDQDAPNTDSSASGSVDQDAINSDSSIPDAIAQPLAWTSNIDLSITSGDPGEVLLNAENASSIMYLNSTLENMIVEADIKLISGNSYHLIIRAEDNGTSLPDGYAFNFNPGLADSDTGLRLSYFPLDIQISPDMPFAGIESLTGWHRVSFSVLTDPDDGLTYLEVNIGTYEEPETGTGQLDYEKVFSVRIDGVSPHRNKDWNRISTTDLTTDTEYLSKWDESINKLYTSGSFAFALTEAGSRIAVKNIALKEISH